MKKSILTVVLFAAGLATSFAAEATLSYGASSVAIIEDAAFSDAFDNGVDAKDFNTTGIAVIDAANQRWAEWATNDLSNVEFDFGFTAAPTADVVINVSGVVGDIYIAGTKVANGDQITLNPADFDATGKLTAAGKAKLAVSTTAPVGQQFCFELNKLKVNGYAGQKLAILNADKTVKVAEFVLGDAYEFDFSGEADNSRFIVEFDGLPAGAGVKKEYVIDVKPTVTPVP